MSLFHFHKSEETSTPTAPQPVRRRHGCLWTVVIFIGIYLVLSLITGAFMGVLFGPKQTQLQDATVYRLAMEGVVVEQAPEDNPMDELLNEFPYTNNSQKEVGLDQLIDNIRLAKTDSRIRGIYLDGGDWEIGMASAKELRDALIDYKTSGKFLIAYAEHYNELSYYIASAADRVYLNPIGSIDWHGFAAIKLYYPRLLEKLNIKMNILKVGTFKSAVEPYFCTEMSDADKAQTMQFLQSGWDLVCSEVGANRSISQTDLNRYADELLELQPQEQCLAYRMVDELLYSYDMDSVLRDYMGTKDYHCLNTSKLASVEREQVKADHEIAVLYAEGEIVDDAEEGIGGKQMLKTIKKITQNEKVKAVVLRVNSPGGSANASEQIWYAVQTLRRKGIPVVVSMGDYAASGGYYISCGADYIFAEPNTLTGSIGIFGLVPDASGLRDQVGIDIDGVGTNKFSASHMVLKGMDSDEHSLMQSMVERGYDLFTSRCAAGRGMTQDEIKQIGEGRVWIGQDALRIGLVDSLGNMDDAIAKAAELANIQHYTMTYYPEKKDFLTELLESFEDTSDEEKLMLRLKTRFSKPCMMALMPEQLIR